MSKKIVLTGEVKRRWIEALRSGEYKQGYGILRTVDNEYCCMGVLQVITDLQVSGSYLLVTKRRSCVRGLPKTMQSRLAMYNDGSDIIDRRDFDWIADFIENGFRIEKA